MAKYIRSLLMAILLVPAFVVAQPCDCKQYTGVIILWAGGLPERIPVLGKLAYLADSLSKEYPYVFIVSPGDNFRCEPGTDSLSVNSSRLIGLMDHCGFKACAISGRDTSIGAGSWAGVLEEAKFPVVSSDFKVPGMGAEKITPYTVLRAGKGNRIVLLGLTQTKDNAGTCAGKFSGLKQKYPVLLGLGCMNIGEGKSLEQSMPELDAIIGVDSWPGQDYIGKVTLVLNQGKIMEQRDEMVRIQDLTGSDARIQKLINQLLRADNIPGSTKL